jgi:protein-L-isoaspartate(D-aspartate) O-methyltransferase
MEDNKDLVQNLIGRKVLRSENIKEALLQIDRANFVIDEYKDLAYADMALPIGYGQTISQPYTVVFMLELLEIEEGHKVLDIGCGSGWTTALLANIVGQSGLVKGLEIIDDLVEMGKKNLQQYDFKNVNIAKAGKNIGLPKEKFDRILVSASASKFPTQLLKQVKNGGIIVVPVRDSIFKFKKISNKEILKEEFPGFSFVKLK